MQGKRRNSTLKPRNILPFQSAHPRPSNTNPAAAAAPTIHNPATNLSPPDTMSPGDTSLQGLSVGVGVGSGSIVQVGAAPSVLVTVIVPYFPSSAHILPITHSHSPPT